MVNGLKSGMCGLVSTLWKIMIPARRERDEKTQKRRITKKVLLLEGKKSSPENVMVINPLFRFGVRRSLLPPTEAFFFSDPAKRKTKNKS